MSPNPDIQKNVLDKIAAGSVEMRSRTYFTLRALGIAALAGAALMIGLFVVSFHLFSIQETGTHALLGFGSDGVLTFASLFPVLPTLFILALLVALEFAARRYTAAYRFSLIRLFALMVISVVAASTLITLTPLHQSLLDAADRDQLPLLKPFYEEMHGSQMMHGIYRGNVVRVSSSTFTIAHDDADRDSDTGTWTVEAPPNFPIHTLQVGEKVFVAGRMHGSAVRAYGVRPMPHRSMMK